MSTPRTLKLLLASTAFIAIGLVAGCNPAKKRPLTLEEVLATDNLVFVGEMQIPDGGSHVFHFFMQPRRGPLAIQALHRHDYLGGNPDFQEIRLDRLGAMKNYIDVRPGSAVEGKLLILLDTATCERGGGASYGWAAPEPQRLKWLTEHIRDRKSKW